MLRPFSIDPKVLTERQEHDKVFGLLLTLSPKFNDVIKHILRADKLPTLDEVCAQLQREEGSIGLFTEGGGGGDLPMANKGVFTQGEKKVMICDHCKRRGHTKDKCWILHPHLKPTKFNQSKTSANTASKENQASQSAAPQAIDAVGTHQPALPIPPYAQSSTNITLDKTDLEALLNSFAAKMNRPGITLYSYRPSTSLVIDSGASHHMIRNPELLSNIEPTLGTVNIANGSQVPIEGIGCLNLFGRETKALYVPKFTSNLISVKKATSDLGCLAIFGSNDFKFQDIKSGEVIGQGGVKDELYVLDKDNSFSLNSFSANKVSMDGIWHARLGHPHTTAFKLMCPDVSFDSTRCEACILGKHCKAVFPTSNKTYENCFDLVHSDVWSSPCTSRDHNKYFVTFIDEKSKYTWLTLIPSKDRVVEAFINFQNFVTNQYNAKIKVFRTDNGGEYTSHRFKDHLNKHGIIHQTSCPYTPQQNGVAERKNRHLMEVARSMLFHNNMPKRFWGDAVMTACYLINRTPTKILQDQSPFEVLHHTTPSIAHMRVFGCVCFVLVPGGGRTKLDPRSVKCVFIGYSPHQKGYKCYDPINQRTYVSRDVKFLEEQGYYDTKNWNDLKDIAYPTTDRAQSLQFLLQQLGTNPTLNQPDNASDHSVSTHESEEETPLPTPQAVPASPPQAAPIVTPEPLDTEEESGGDTTEAVQDSDEDHVADLLPAPVLRRSTRVRKDPTNWKNTRTYYNRSAVAHPIQEVCSLASLPTHFQAFLSKIDQEQIPQTYGEAVQSQNWTQAVDDEVGAMTRNHTWDEEDLPPGKRSVSSKWVFTIKYKSNGDIERYKARLVARGFTQTYGDDYTDTFAPVAKQPTVKVVMSLAVNLDWEMWQMDVKNAFLQGELTEEVYMTPPPGIKITPGKVLRLRKAIYGLKQSPRAWYHKLSSTLKASGFRRSEADHTLFTRQTDQGIVLVLVYVDDLIISGNDKAGIQAIKTSLHTAFDIKDLGELKYFLGIEVCRSKEGLFLSQRKYTLDLLKLTGKLGAKPAKTPLEAGYKVLRKGEEEDGNDKPYEDAAQYRRLVGKLIYLTYTRPDICFAVNQVSQHMQSPTMHHWKMLERVLRYLKGSPGQGIWMGRNSSTEIVGYCDADWAGDRTDRKSTTGYCTFVGGNLVTWKTKKQKVVSSSSAEAEYRAMRKLTDELVWLKVLLEDLSINSVDPITMHCDNQAAIHIANNQVFHERTKHIEIDCHRVREKIEDGVILPCYTRSEDQLADILTKSTSEKICTHICKKLGLVDLTQPSTRPSP